MRGFGKVVALVASVAMFVMPATPLPLHCVLMAHQSAAGPHPCGMMRFGAPSGNQTSAVPSELPCCHVSPAKTESTVSAPLPSFAVYLAAEIVLPKTAAAPAFTKNFDENERSPGHSPQAVLCTFLI